jgi:sulfofructose kinase
LNGQLPPSGTRRSKTPVDQKRWDILGIGSAAVDDLVYVEHFPAPDSKLPVQGMRRQGGGLTATALVTAARHSARTAYLGCLGDDELARFTLTELEREGVDCSPTQRIQGACPFHAVVIVDLSGCSRTILYSGEGYREPDPQGITAELIASCKVLFVDHLVPRSGIRAAGLARNLNIPIVADFEENDDPNFPDYLALIDHLLIGAPLAARLSGESAISNMVKALARPECTCCVVTAGELGCWYSERGGQIIHVPAFHVAVMDTTGCGDVFHGAYAASIARGESVAHAVRIASAASALKATQPGGRSGIPDLQTTLKFLKEGT